jgi:hypothetical protein
MFWAAGILGKHLLPIRKYIVPTDLTYLRGHSWPTHLGTEGMALGVALPMAKYTFGVRMLTAQTLRTIAGRVLLTKVQAL